MSSLFGENTQVNTVVAAPQARRQNPRRPALTDTHAPTPRRSIPDGGVSALFDNAPIDAPLRRPAPGRHVPMWETPSAPAGAPSSRSAEEDIYGVGEQQNEHGYLGVSAASLAAPRETGEIKRILKAALACEAELASDQYQIDCLIDNALARARATGATFSLQGISEVLATIRAENYVSTL